MQLLRMRYATVNNVTVMMDYSQVARSLLHYWKVRSGVSHVYVTNAREKIEVLNVSRQKLSENSKNSLIQ